MSEILEITSQEKIFDNIDTPVTVKAGGELKCYGNPKGDITVEAGGSLRLYGNPEGDITVKAGGAFRLYGVASGDIVVKEGGEFYLYGSAENDIVLEGDAEFHNNGTVLGQVLRIKNGTLTVESQEEKKENVKSDESSALIKSVFGNLNVQAADVTVISTDTDAETEAPPYTVTGEETSFKAISGAITVKKGGCFRFFGITPKPITVEEGGKLYLYGIAGNGILGEGYVEVHGILNGKVAPTLDAIISESAIINISE